MLKKRKPNDIQTNTFSIHVRPLWEANANAQFILDPYAIVAYCIFYLTNVDKLSHEKCKCEEIEALE
jgi:hypothetical protein